MSDALETSIMYLPLKPQRHSTDAQDITRAQIGAPAELTVVQIRVIPTAEILCDIRVLALINQDMMMRDEAVVKNDVIVRTAPNGQLMPHGITPSLHRHAAP